MDINAIRIARLNLLVKKYEQDEANAGRRARRLDFAEKIGMSQQMLSALCNSNKSLGKIVARRIEKSLGLRDGYMDTPINQIALDSETQAHYVEEFLAVLKDTDYAYARLFLDAMKSAKGAERSKLYVLFDLFHKNLK